jgi:O-antigen/teichoic acid export membrane protein
MLGSGIQAVLGFTFWIIVTHLYSTEEVGLGSSLISATSLITFFALFGLNSTLMRFLPTARNKHSLVTTSFTLVAGAGAVIGLLYILLTPIIAPPVSFVVHRPLMLVAFVLLTAAAAVNQITDTVFIASRKSAMCALTDAVVGGSSKIVFCLIFAGAGAFGIYGASIGGFATAASASIYLIMATFGWRPTFKRIVPTLKPLLKFSGVNYAANAVELLPTLIVPLIVLDRLGARDAAYYSVAFQMSGLLYTAVYAVEAAFLAEGSQPGADWRAVRASSRRLAVKLFVPGAVVMALAAHWILLAFGAKYSQDGTTSLELLAVSVVPLAACNWAWTVLRLTNGFTGLLISNATYSVAICVFAWFLAPHGLTATAAAWVLGSAVAAIVGTVFSARASKEEPSRPRPEKHAARRPDRTRHSATFQR